MFRDTTWWSLFSIDWNTKAGFYSEQIAVAPLSDKSLQLWAVDSGGIIWSCWKKDSDANSNWTEWMPDWAAQGFYTKHMFDAGRVYGTKEFEETLKAAAHKAIEMNQDAGL